MLFRGGVVTVIGNDSGDVQTERPFKATSDLVGLVIKDTRRQVGEMREAGKEVGGKKKPKALTEVSGMPPCMPWHVNSPQAMPDVQSVSIVEQSIRCESLVRKQVPPNGFHDASAPCNTPIRGAAVIVTHVKPWSGNPCVIPPGKRNHIENVINMSVRDYDAPYGYVRPTSLCERPMQTS